MYRVHLFHYRHLTKTRSLRLWNAIYRMVRFLIDEHSFYLYPIQCFTITWSKRNSDVRFRIKSSSAAIGLPIRSIDWLAWKPTPLETPTIPQQFILLVRRSLFVVVTVGIRVIPTHSLRWTLLHLHWRTNPLSVNSRCPPGLICYKKGDHYDRLLWPARFPTISNNRSMGGAKIVSTQISHICFQQLHHRLRSSFSCWA